jgi:anti-sigma factor RsiW
VSAAKAVCVRFDRWLSAYVDEELDAVHALEVEEHLGVCSPCSELVASLRATRGSLQRACKLPCPSSLRERVLRSVEGERLYDEAHRKDSLEASVRTPEGEEPPASQLEPGASVRPAPEGSLGKLRFVVPLAAAATFALVFGATRLREFEVQPVATTERSSNAPVEATASLDNLVEDLVAQHMHPPPPETTDPEGLRRFDQFIGVKVRPPKFDQDDIKWTGGRLIHPRAAALQYMVRDRQRLTMYVFDPRKVMMQTGRLAPRRLEAGMVYVGHVRGYTVAACERDDVGYALASDLSDDESARLLAKAR